VVTVRGSEESVEARLRAGLLACSCGGMLRPWGWARPRRVATFTGTAGARPRRGICRDGCGKTHVLLPAGLLSRRRYAAAVIFAALALAALEAVTAGLRRGFPGLATVTAVEVAAHLTGGLLLAPGLPPLAGNTTLAGLAAVSPS
jgi:hypothetical protein